MMDFRDVGGCLPMQHQRINHGLCHPMIFGIYESVGPGTELAFHRIAK